MLVLSRKRNETIQIGPDITIKVTEIRGGKVRLGIQADPDIPVHRGEIYQRIQDKKAGMPDALQSSDGSTLRAG